MSKVLVPLAPGCEELEAITVIDLMRRAGIEVVTAGLLDGPVTASRGTVLVPDTTLDRVLGDAFDMIVLPGGLPGADHLAGDERVLNLVRSLHGQGKIVAAVCAAPKVLARAGVLQGRRATSFPGVLERLELPDTRILEDAVVIDGNVVTSRGPGTSMDFALELIAMLEGHEVRRQVESPLQRPLAGASVVAV